VVHVRPWSRDQLISPSGRAIITIRRRAVSATSLLQIMRARTVRALSTSGHGRWNGARPPGPAVRWRSAIDRDEYRAILQPDQRAVGLVIRERGAQQMGFFSQVRPRRRNEQGERARPASDPAIHRLRSPMYEKKEQSNVPSLSSTKAGCRSSRRVDQRHGLTQSCPGPSMHDMPATGWRTIPAAAPACVFVEHLGRITQRVGAEACQYPALNPRAITALRHTRFPPNEAAVPEWVG